MITSSVEKPKYIIKRDSAKSYRLGKILSKYIILDIMSYSLTLPAIIELIGKSSYNYRRLLIENIKVLRNYQTICDKTIEIDFPDTFL